MGKLAPVQKIEPEELLIGDIEYRQLEFENPLCALCSSGDMIPPEERFFSSKYRPDSALNRRALGKSPVGRFMMARHLTGQDPTRESGKN